MRIVEDFRHFVTGGGYGKKIATILSNPCFHCVCLYRFSAFLWKIHLKPLSKMVWYLNRMWFHVDIDPRADLAGGFLLVHGLGTVIGCHVKSEGWITVYQGITLGGNQGREKVLEDGTIIQQPLLKDKVIIYTDVGVFGPVVLSEGTVVKAKEIVTHDK